MLLSFNLLAACGAILSTAAAVPTTVSISVSIRRYKAPKAQYCDLKKYYIKPNCKALYGPAWVRRPTKFSDHPQKLMVPHT